MEIKTYGRTSAPVPDIVPIAPPVTDPPTPPVVASAVQNPSTMTPTRVLANMTPGYGAVLQNIQYDRVNKQYFTTQTGAGTNGTSSPYETTYLSRISSTGTLLDMMTLQDAGHGYGLDIEVVGKTVYIWLTYNRPIGTGAKYDLVRFPYVKGVFSRDKIPGLVNAHRFDTHYSTYSFDWDNNWYLERFMDTNNTTMICQRRKITELNSSTDHVYNTVNVDLTNQTLQGNCTVNDSLLVLVGGANGELLTPPQPTQIWKYSWATGARTNVADLSTLGQQSDGSWYGGQHEPEGLNMYRESDGRASVIFNVTMSAPNTKHTWPVWVYKNIGDAVP